MDGNAIVTGCQVLKMNAFANLYDLPTNLIARTDISKVGTVTVSLSLR